MSPFVARIRRGVVVVSGPDAVTWLQGQLSQDVAGLPVGGAAPTFVLSPQGKVAGWGRVARPADDVLRIDVDPGAGPAWIARLGFPAESAPTINSSTNTTGRGGFSDGSGVCLVPPSSSCSGSDSYSESLEMFDVGPTNGLNLNHRLVCEVLVAAGRVRSVR